MRGRPTSPSNKRPLTLPLLLFFAAVLWGCSAAKEAEQKVDLPAPKVDDLKRYEKAFNPSDFDSDIKLIKDEEKTERSTFEAAHVVTTAVPDTVPGFRIQVLLTQDIDEAVHTRDSVESLIPEEWTYIVYDSPYYKVRLGNCEDRGAAGPLLKKISSLGFKGAWIVPDNVVRNLPPKPPDTSVEPQKQFENKH